MSDVRLFQDANAIDSLRNSDFDSISAYGEVVDNSIQAGAKNIRIKLFTKPGARGYEHIERIAFGDDGHGMDIATVHQCLQIGWSSRYNQRGGIGRFGVGMTLAAIHECKRVEIYSKQEDGQWTWTYMDLDELATGEQEYLPEPVTRKLPEECVDLVGSNSGVLVIWSKYDRQSANASRLREDAIIWMGRTYRYFIWEDDVSISIDGEDVKAIDPLYHKTDKTGFPDDPPSELFPDIAFNWKVDEFDAPPDAPKESLVRIRTSLIDKSFRPTAGSGGSSEAKKRFINMNEGISILRNRREVFYGAIPYWASVGKIKGWPQFEDKDRFWGCEIHFDAVLDRAFTVKNIKRGADPSSPLKEAIKTQILPTRQSCIEQIDKVWAEARQSKREEEASKDDPLNLPKDHKDAERAAKVTATDKSELDAGKDFDDEADEFVKKKVANYTDEQRAMLKALFASQPFTILEATWRGPQFVESTHLGGNSVLRYNMQHTFFEEVYRIIESLDDDDCEPKLAARNLKALLDILIIAYSKGEARFPPDANMSADEFIQNMSANWGQYLQSYVRSWKAHQEDG